MNSIDKIRQSIDYIEKHLSEELTLSGLAQAAFYSEYHYHRIFQHFVGDTVMSYIRRRRLSKAAEQLTGTERRVLDIALECGFRNPETFSRAFRKMYGMLPTECRQLGTVPFLIAPVWLPASSAAPHLKEWREFAMQPKIITLPAKRVIGYALHTNVAEGQNFKEIPAFWQHYIQNKLWEQIPGKQPPYVELGICTPADNEGRFRYIIGFETSEDEAVPEGLVEFHLQEAQYAVFTTPPADEAEFSSTIQHTWDLIFRNWFPESGYEYAKAPDIEWYDERSSGTTNKQMDIYIPVKPAL
ncbi:AraC family transcriptional regulator [Paenibacillus sp. CAA11]|uniref:AraC family transcriptional regulator n=1 Tax=Paenibacillus sp. CAA11 TaxID=1532905 RepID=UPI000D39B630|nr:AraC family transcriptional regulator [Paenibacillus sp. CAA11]AWB43339.1 AraC family transcriptional regulator [Paenibacillus sp. CAA11]